jgi:3-hydroxybutyryl-CoA dehydrogenase
MKKCEYVNKVAIIGAGLMGYGIGIDFVRAGYETWMFNMRTETSRMAMQRAKEALSLFVEAGILSAVEADAAYARLHPTISIEEAAENADYVSESALESLSLKRRIFADLDRLCPATCILTTNSSSFNHINH